MAEKGKRKGRAEEYELPEYEEDVIPEYREEPKAELQPLQEEPLELLEERRYFVDPQWYEEHGLVFGVVAQGRLCPSCTSKLGTFVEERYPVIDPKTKRVTFQTRQVPYAVNPLPIIRDCCSRSREYITPETPLLEAVFRIYLANGNQPMPMSTVREHLLTYLPEMAALRSDYPAELLERLVRGDRTYGLREHKLPVGV